MPFIRFKGFSKPFVMKITPELVRDFSYIANIPEEIVKVELLHVERITDTPLSVEIYMFQRKQEIHDRISSMIHNHLVRNGYHNVHIFYVILTHSLYYKEGKPLTEIPAKKEPLSSLPEG